MKLFSFSAKPNITSFAKPLELIKLLSIAFSYNLAFVK